MNRVLFSIIWGIVLLSGPTILAASSDMGNIVIKQKSQEYDTALWGGLGLNFHGRGLSKLESTAQRAVSRAIKNAKNECENTYRGTIVGSYCVKDIKEWDTFKDYGAFGESTDYAKATVHVVCKAQKSNMSWQMWKFYAEYEVPDLGSCITVVDSNSDPTVETAPPISEQFNSGSPDNGSQKDRDRAMAYGRADRDWESSDHELIIEARLNDPNDSSYKDTYPKDSEASWKKRRHDEKELFKTGIRDCLQKVKIPSQSPKASSLALEATHPITIGVISNERVDEPSYFAGAVSNINVPIKYLHFTKVEPDGNLLYFEFVRHYPLKDKKMAVMRAENSGAGTWDDERHVWLVACAEDWNGNVAAAVRYGGATIENVSRAFGVK